jgi:hypothetical protein
MSKPVVKCGRVSFAKVLGYEVAFLDRLSDHPKLGPPRCESQTRTSIIVNKDLANRRFETMNTIYEIVDYSYMRL